MVAASPEPTSNAPLPASHKPSYLFVSQNCSYLFPANIELKSFPDKESHILIQDVDAWRGAFRRGHLPDDCSGRLLLDSDIRLPLFEKARHIHLRRHTDTQ